jgi:hypothetical protein
MRSAKTTVVKQPTKNKMKKFKLTPSERLGSTALCAGLCLFGGSTLDIRAQLTPGQKRQLSEIVGARAETAAILGSSDSASGGTYTFDRPGEDAELDMFKFGCSNSVDAANWAHHARSATAI